MESSPVLYALGAFELLLNTVGVPVSALNLLLIARTSLIHPNLKFILLNQSGAILIRGSTRLVVDVLKFVLPTPMDSEHIRPLGAVYYLSLSYRNLLIHVLIVERAAAIRLVHSYEHQSHRLLYAAICSVSFTLSLVVEFAIGPLKTDFIILGLAVAELVAFQGMLRHNERAYKRTADGKLQQQNSLSTQYQLSQNIRNGRQLLPAMYLHLGNILVTTVATLYMARFDQSLGANNIVPDSMVVLGTLFSLLIEVTMITCHPFLRRDLRGLVRRAARRLGLLKWATSRVGDAAPGGGEGSGGFALRNIFSGDPVVVAPDAHAQSRHFDMLKRAWEQ